ncbi:hypothetical protein BX070DRAFT_125704 [Coemansia spiralis]|nr:hypothetical protein BX070DRAFT_125704 [Coemansia spiralis]
MSHRHKKLSVICCLLLSERKLAGLLLQNSHLPPRKHLFHHANITFTTRVLICKVQYFIYHCYCYCLFPFVPDVFTWPTSILFGAFLCVFS